MGGTGVAVAGAHIPVAEVAVAAAADTARIRQPLEDPDHKAAKWSFT